jgi:hypothetical protein
MAFKNTTQLKEPFVLSAKDGSNLFFQWQGTCSEQGPVKVRKEKVLPIRLPPQAIWALSQMSKKRVL